MTEDERRQHVLRILGRRSGYQFGQPPATCSLVGQSACTDTCIQLIVKMTKGLRVSLNEVRRRSGATPNTPMNTGEALRALTSFGLPYEIRNDMGASGVLKVARKRGPVIVCEQYWSHPQWKGYTYAGRTLQGTATNGSGNKVRPGFAKPWERAGLTQWTFRDGHAVVAATDTWEHDVHFGVIRDPNHNSPSRPERPAYDLVTVAQLGRMLDSYKARYGYRVVLAPTRVVIK